MSIVQTSDFLNEYKISKDIYTDLSDYIATYEKEYLIKLLGSSLYDLFIADLTAPTPQVPQAARFIDLFYPFHLDDDSCVMRSEGIKKMLVQFIYYEFVRNMSTHKTSTGVVKTEKSISTGTPYKGFNLVEAYNKGVTNCNMIQWFILDNDNDYPEENMQQLEYISGI